jgi:hypothetical protein
MRAQLSEVDIIEAPRIHVDLVRIRSRHIKGVNAAMPAECMFCGASVKTVSGQVLGAAQKLKLPGRHDEMQKAFFGADRAVALGHAGEISGDPKPDTAAVTAALKAAQHRLKPYDKRAGGPTGVKLGTGL